MKKIQYYIICLPLILFETGCKKFVEIDPPQNQLVTSSVFANDQTAIAATTAIYSASVRTGNLAYIIPFYTGLSGDELTNYSTTNNHADMYQNALKAVDSPSNNLWTNLYNIIYLANSSYEGCGNSDLLSPSVKKQLMAEALFMRAFCNFYLVNLFGDVPLVTTTDYQTNARLKRTPTREVYQQILSDLKTAQANLSITYVTGNSIGTTSQRLRPNKAVATALLAKVYLYMKMYPDAEQQSSALLQEKSTYSLEPLNKVFLADSKEAIWQLMTPTPNNNINTYEGNFFILQTSPQTGTQNTTTISQKLMGDFTAGDQRKAIWIGKYTNTNVNPNVDYYFPYKYKVYSSMNVTEHSVPLRLAEQFLIRAEARAQQGNISGAVNDVDSIRARAGLPLIQNIKPGIGKDELMEEIIKERELELFAEWGHRWMDLKRTERINSVMNIVSPNKGGTWSSFKQLWPIPQREIQNNNNLSQNPDYN